MTLTGEAKREYQREWMRQRRETFFADKVCVQCSSTDRLELDHIDRSTKVTHKIWSWSQPRRDAEVAKCQVLCYDCHKAKTRDESLVDYKHGDLGRYKKRGCRCNLCKQANAINMREWRNRQTQPA